MHELLFNKMALDLRKGAVHDWGVVLEEATAIPALSHVVCISGPDHEDSNISQSHQEVLTCTWLPVSTAPWRLSARRKKNHENFNNQQFQINCKKKNITIIHPKHTSLKVTVMVWETRGRGLVWELCSKKMPLPWRTTSGWPSTTSERWRGSKRTV